MKTKHQKKTMWGCKDLKLKETAASPEICIVGKEQSVPFDRNTPKINLEPDESHCYQKLMKFVLFRICWE